MVSEGLEPGSIVLDTMLVGDLSAEYGPKCALPAKFLVFGIQVVMTTPFKNFDGSNFLGQVHGRHLGFQNGRHQ